jgi:hypothetical protein
MTFSVFSDSLLCLWYVLLPAAALIEELLKSYQHVKDSLFDMGSSFNPLSFYGYSPG